MLRQRLSARRELGGTSFAKRDSVGKCGHKDGMFYRTVEGLKNTVKGAVFGYGDQGGSHPSRKSQKMALTWVKKWAYKSKMAKRALKIAFLGECSLF